MITDDPRKTEIYRRTTQQLKNVFDTAAWARVLQGRWLLTAGYVGLMAAALPTPQGPWYRTLLFFIGCGFGLAATYVSSTRRAPRHKLGDRPTGNESE